MSDLPKVTVRQGQWRAKVWVSLAQGTPGIRGVEMVQSPPSLAGARVHMCTHHHAITSTFRFVVPKQVL